MARIAQRRTPSQELSIRSWSREPAVLPWLERTIELVRGRLTQKDPVAASRAYALVSVATHDAIVATWRAKYRYRRPAPKAEDPLVPAGSAPSYPSEHAAAAGAASRVLAYAFAEHPAPRFEEMATEAANSRVQAGVNVRSDVEAGLDLGRAVANKVIARAKQDRFDTKWDGERPRGRKYWRPPPGSVAAPSRPNAGQTKTWVLRSGSQLRPEPPAPYASSEFVAEAREVLKVSRDLTPRQKRIANIWAGGEGTPLPPGLWNQVTFNLVREERLSTPRAARAFALVNVAMSDAAVAVWDAKYTFWSPRPDTAIRDLGLDRHWKPYLKTPFFPSYVSGHSTFSAAAAEVLAYLFPDRAREFRARAREAAMSRLYGGIHFRSDNDVGLRMGREIGRLVVKRAKQDRARSR
jgi:membrane-associated phospholipid phosphatase